MKIVSWNVNGIRSCVQKGFLDYLRAESPDVICLQEVKATETENPITLDLHDLGYRIAWHSAEKKGYSGTAVFTRMEPVDVTVGMAPHWEDREGRVITVQYPACTLVNVYTPNAKRELERLPGRMEWDRTFCEYLCELERTSPVILCGDLNVAHQSIDLANPAANRGNAGYTPEERSGMDRYVAHGFVDTFRAIRPDEPGQYSWWSNFAGSRARNIGWRIDYVLVSGILRERIREAFIRQEVMGSDHCPVGVVLDIG